MCDYPVKIVYESLPTTSIFRHNRGAIRLEIGARTTSRYLNELKCILKFTVIQIENVAVM